MSPLLTQCPGFRAGFSARWGLVFVVTPPVWDRPAGRRQPGHGPGAEGVTEVRGRCANGIYPPPSPSWADDGGVPVEGDLFQLSFSRLSKRSGWVSPCPPQVAGRIGGAVAALGRPSREAAGW